MSVEPQAFLDLAVTLLTQEDTEVAQRSAVSRAYYAAFHEAVSLLNQRGLAPGNRLSHEDVARRIAQISIPDAVQQAQWLRDLRSEDIMPITR